MAGQEGTYLGKLFAKQLLRPGVPLPPSAKPFRWSCVLLWRLLGVLHR